MKFIKRIVYQWIENNFLGGCSDYNPLEVRKKCRSKKQARQLFKNLEIPHAKGTVFFNPFTALRFVQQHGFPVVIKPNVSGFSRGSHFPIKNLSDFWKAVLAVKIWWPTSIIEEYLEGKNYRVVVVKEGLMSVIRRYPPFVEGDGTKSINELINEENAVRQKMSLYPVIHPIKINKETIKFLKKQNLTLQSIPASGIKVFLHNKIALAPGGVVKTVNIEKIPLETQKLFQNLLKTLNANILGIDAIFEKGIEFDHKSQNVIFLEINSRPYLKMHDFPRYGEQVNLSKHYQTLEQIQLSDAGIF